MDPRSTRPTISPPAIWPAQPNEMEPAMSPTENLLVVNARIAERLTEADRIRRIRRLEEPVRVRHAIRRALQPSLRPAD